MTLVSPKQTELISLIETPNHEETTTDGSAESETKMPYLKKVKLRKECPNKKFMTFSPKNLARKVLFNQ